MLSTWSAPNLLPQLMNNLLTLAQDDVSWISTTMKNIFSLFKQWFSTEKSNPVYGSKVFSQKSWLEKQVDEGFRKKAFWLE